MMRHLHLTAGILFALFLTNGCGAGLHPKMPTYLGATKNIENAGQLHSLQDSQLKTGLLIINDTTSQDSAPPLSQDQLASLTQWVQGRMNQDLPIIIEQVIAPPDFTSKGMHQFVQAGKAQGLDHLMLVIISSSEIEVPDQFPLCGRLQGGVGCGTALGFRAENYALAEIAILDVVNGQVLLQAEGQDWASLDRLNVPLASNLYPVIFRAQQTTSPIYPTEAAAHDTLRGVAASEAMTQAIMHLKEAWADRLPS